jgi:hypothetical protein
MSWKKFVQGLTGDGPPTSAPPLGSIYYDKTNDHLYISEGNGIMIPVGTGGAEQENLFISASVTAAATVDVNEPECLFITDGVTAAATVDVTEL